MSLIVMMKTIADRLFTEGSHEESYHFYTIILEKEPNNVSVLLNRSLAGIKIRNLETALTDALKATQIEPNKAKCWHRLGIALIENKKHDDALIANQKAFELEPTNQIYRRLVPAGLVFNESLHNFANQIMNGSDLNIKSLNIDKKNAVSLLESINKTIDNIEESL